MQINNLGFAGLLGAGSVNTAADTGASLGQAFGLLLGAPSTPAGAGITPPLAVNDVATPVAATPNLPMAQLLTTAAPLTPAPMPTAAASVAATLQATNEASVPATPDITAADAKNSADPLTGELPAPTEDAAALVPPAADKPVVQGKPSKPAPEAKPEPGLDPLAGPAPEAPVAEVQTEKPVEDAQPQTPVKRGPRRADTGEDLPAADPATIPADAPRVDMVAVAVAPTPVRPEIAVKPQPSPTRQIGEVTTGARKTDMAHTEPAGAQPAGSTEKGHATVSAVAGKTGDGADSKPSDDRGQAPAFTLRQDAHAAAPAHTASEPSRSTAAPTVAAAEPVVAARPGHLGQQMGVEIARKVEAGEDTLRVRLSPDSLGKVEVTLSFDDRGKLHATVRAESQHALDMLRQDAPDLGRALDQAGIRADAGSFRFESRDGGSGAQAQQQQGQNNSAGQLAGNDEPETTEAAYREIRGDGQVDLLA